MKWKPVSSRNRYCISRFSRMATSTGSSARKVLSSTRPVRTFLSLVRTNAPPLPGLTCWNPTTFMSAPSMLSVIPFLRSLVVGMAAMLPPCLRRPSGDAGDPPVELLVQHWQRHAAGAQHRVVEGPDVEAAAEALAGGGAPPLPPHA